MGAEGSRESIVVGTDGSDTAKQAVEEAIRQAKVLGGELHVVSGYSPLRGARVAGAAEGAGEVSAPLPDAEVKRILEEAGAVARIAGVPVEVHAIENDGAEALLEVATNVDATLIVVGNRGMHGAKRLLGSVPNKVSHQARCNVLIVATGRD